MNIQPTNMTFNARIQVEGGFSKLVNTFVSASNRFPYKYNMSCGDFCKEIQKIFPDNNDIVKFDNVQDNPNDLTCSFQGEIIKGENNYSFNLNATYMSGTAPMGKRVLKRLKELIEKKHE